MADINIRRKKKPVWPWLLALLIVVGIIWILAETTGNPEEGPVEENIETPDNNTSMDTVSSEGAAGNEFSWFVNEHEPPAGDEVEAGYIIEGMDHLSATLGSVVDKKFINDPEVNEKRSTLTSKIDQLKADSAADRLPGNVKEAFVSAADLMASLQEKSYPDLDGTVSDLKKVAASIETSSDKDAIKSKVDEFFEESSYATLQMTDSTGGNL